MKRGQVNSPHAALAALREYKYSSTCAEDVGFKCRTKWDYTHNVCNFNETAVVLEPVTSIEQPDSHCRNLDDILVVANVASIHGGTLCTEATVIQLHDLLAGL